MQRTGIKLHHLINGIGVKISFLLCHGYCVIYHFLFISSLPVIMEIYVQTKLPFDGVSECLQWTDFLETTLEMNKWATFVLCHGLGEWVGGNCSVVRLSGLIEYFCWMWKVRETMLKDQSLKSGRTGFSCFLADKWARELKNRGCL